MCVWKVEEGGGCVVKADTHSKVNLIHYSQTCTDLQISTMYSKLTRGQKTWSLHILIRTGFKACRSYTVSVFAVYKLRVTQASARDVYVLYSREGRMHGNMCR